MNGPSFQFFPDIYFKRFLAMWKYNTQEKFTQTEQHKASGLDRKLEFEV